MFTPEGRTQLRDELLKQAATDPRITGAAVTGSAAESREDEWSDIDLAFGVAADAGVPGVLADWTRRMYGHHHALHHLDVIAGAWTYRVFLLENALQVDLAFVVETEFRPLAPTFRLVFGQAHDALPPAPANAEAMIGMAWLYALHVRSAIARGKLWQAEYMISGMRDSVLAIACLRHGVSPVHGRGLDLLPPEALAPFEQTLIQQLTLSELNGTFQAIIRLLVGEIRGVDQHLAGRLEGVLVRLGASHQP